MPKISFEAFSYPFITQTVRRHYWAFIQRLGLAMTFPYGFAPVIQLSQWRLIYACMCPQAKRCVFFFLLCWECQITPLCCRAPPKLWVPDYISVYLFTNKSSNLLFIFRDMFCGNPFYCEIISEPNFMHTATQSTQQISSGRALLTATV